MKFTLDFDIDVDETTHASAAMLVADERLRAKLGDVGEMLGRIVLRVDNVDLCGAYADPLVRLMDQWLRKLPWIIGGDTETVALRNSEQCFALVPAAESVEFSFFNGTEVEVEEYVVEPTTVRMEPFIGESIAAAERLLAVCRAVDPSSPTTVEDVRDLAASLAEVKRVWHEHQIHQRR